MKNSVQTGSVITLVDSAITKPSHTDGFTHADDPVVVGVLVGVAYNSASASTDLVDIETDGVFNLSCVGTTGSNSAIAIGDKLYIHASTAVISKTTANVPFGVALGTVGSGLTATIPVKLRR